jgi:manganese/zinc/iron transport system substrate-binding protein
MKIPHKMISIVMILFINFCAYVSDACAQKPIRVVATIGQIADAVRIIGGEYIQVEGLMGAGVDPHLYKASEGDVRKLAEADIIFYNGLKLEAKMEHIFEKMGRQVKTVALGDALTHDRLLDSENYPGHFDPHIWFDVPLWQKIVEGIRDELGAFDAVHKPYYDARAADYLKKLEELHLYVQRRAQEVPPQQRVLVTAHDAFRYFGRGYQFKVMGLQGISTQSEAGAADVKRLADFIAERRIKAVFIESSVPERNIQAVQEAVKARGWSVRIAGELFSDAMGDEGTFEGTYIGMVTHNINTIAEALK